MAVPGGRRSSVNLNWSKFTVHYLGIDSVGLEQSQPVGELSLFILASEEVNSLLYRVRLPLSDLTGVADVAASSLDEGVHATLHCEFDPFLKIQMEDEHFIDESAVLSLTTVHDHTLLEHSRTVVLS